MSKHLRRGIMAIAGLLALAGALVLYREVDPTSTALFPKCLFLDLTSLYCPGCGAQRALHALLNGDLVAAIGFNAMLMIAGPVVCIGWMGSRIARYIGEHRRYRPVLLHRAIPFLVIGFWIARNTPFFPFSVLAP